MSSTSQTNYQKTKLIHSGTNVQVYEGLHTNFGRQVAIKELKGEANESVRNEFFKEAESWARIEHHRLCRIEEVNRERGWIVAEYLPNSFTDRFRGNVNLMEIKDAFLQILEGLDFLHQKGFLHCNLSSSNIRFDEPGEGAKLCDGRSVPIAQSSQLPRPKGSNKYRAPEMLDNRFGPIGMATDLYLAATVVFEGLAGEKFDSLFQGFVSGTPDPETGWFRWHNSDDQLEPTKTLIAGIPDAFGKLLDDMLSKNVGRRIGSARDAINELNQIDMSGTASAQSATAAPAADAGSSAAPSGAAPSAPKPPAPPKPASGSSAPSAEPQLISRPSTPAYMRIASGSQAGKIYPLKMEDIVIGEADHCQVKLLGTDYPPIVGREVTVALAAGGWKVSETKRPEDCMETVMVGREVCKGTHPIKSGDIIRLSNRGPDIQFVIQGEASWSWQDVADELNMNRGAKPDSAPSAAPKKAAPSTEQKTAPLGTAPQAPAAPARSPKAPQPATPKKSAKVDKRAKAPKPASPKPKPAAPPAAAAPPAPAAPAPPSNAPAAPAPPAKDKKGKAKKPKGESSGNWLQDKNKRNWLVLIGGLLLALILIPFVVPQSGGDKDEDKDKTEQVENNENENKKESNDKDKDSDKKAEDDSDSKNESKDKKSGG